MYRLQFEHRVEKDFAKIDKTESQKIKHALNKFISNFSDEYEKELLKTKKIKLLKGKFKGLHRLKIRTFRVVYKKKEDYLIILVLRVGHRKNIYQKQI